MTGPGGVRIRGPRARPPRVQSPPMRGQPLGLRCSPWATKVAISERSSKPFNDTTSNSSSTFVRTPRVRSPVFLPRNSRRRSPRWESPTPISPSSAAGAARGTRSGEGKRRSLSSKSTAADWRNARKPSPTSSSGFGRQEACCSAWSVTRPDAIAPFLPRDFERRGSSFGTSRRNRTRGAGGPWRDREKRAVAR